MTAQTIIHDALFLARKAAPATKADQQVAQDLLDTLVYHHVERDGLSAAAGLAANMIGQSKAIIAVYAGFLPMVMLNPKIVKRAKPYLATEGCLSLSGEKTTQRFDEITVSYQDRQLQPHVQNFTGFVAETIQHEVDHCQGILI
ncbi:peptide deformylase [Lactobacillus porci]|uniref:peptide deformylase n=1 Tax=Lactobacillus porci TaxID=2012477 RepID=UPI003991D6D3